jgi:alpha-glucuronidase
MKIQTKDASWWKDACLMYFEDFSQESVPYEMK